MTKYPTTEKYVTLPDGAKLHVSITGNGRPALFPCVGTSPSYERPLEDNSLKEEFTFYFVEVRGSSSRSSGVPEDTASLERIADDLEEVRKALGIEKMVGLSHSRNGMMIAQYALKYPEHVSCLICLSTPESIAALEDGRGVKSYWAVFADEERRRRYGQDEALRDEAQIDDYDSPEKLSRLYELESAIYFYDMNRTMAGWNDPTVACNTWDVVFITNEKWADFSLLETVKQVKVPVYLTYGKYDFMVPPLNKPGEPVDGSAGLYRDIPGVTVEVFDKSGHYQYLEEEEEFMRRIRNWLESVGV